MRVLLIAAALAFGVVSVVLVISVPLPPLRFLAGTPERNTDPPTPKLEPAAVARALGLKSTTPPRIEPEPPRPRAKLRGTLRATVDTLSLAVLDLDGVAHVVSLGTELEGWSVESISRTSVEFIHGTSRWSVGVGGGTASSVAVSAPRASVEQHVLSRADLERRVAEQAAQVMSSTRLVPVQREGGLAFKVAFPAGSPLEALGIKSGDVVRTMNGEAVTPQLAAAMMARWPHLSSLELGVERDGQLLALAYRVE